MMCLATVYKGKKKKAELAKLPEMVTCYKVVNQYGNQHGSFYRPEYQSGCFSVGWNVVKPEKLYYYSKYKVAYHAFLTRKDAKKWKDNDRWTKIVKCKTEKKDIGAIGKQRDFLVIVTRRIWIPKSRKKSA